MLTGENTEEFKTKTLAPYKVDPRRTLSRCGALGRSVAARLKPYYTRGQGWEDSHCVEKQWQSSKFKPQQCVVAHSAECLVLLVVGCADS